MSGIASLEEVAVGKGLAEWVEAGSVNAMVERRTHELQVLVQHTGLVLNWTLYFCIRARERSW